MQPFEEFPEGARTATTFGQHFHVVTQHEESRDHLDRGTFSTEDTARSYARTMAAQCERRNIPAEVWSYTCYQSCPIYRGN